MASKKFVEKCVKEADSSLRNAMSLRDRIVDQETKQCIQQLMLAIQSLSNAVSDLNKDI